MIDKFQQNDYILHLDLGWLYQDILRWIGSGIVYGLMWLNDVIENIVDKSISLNDFYSTGPMKEFMDVCRPIIWGLFLLALLVLGFQFMLNKVEKRNEIFLNVILAVCMIVVIPDLMVNMGKITNAGINQIKPEATSLSAQLVKSNVADVLYYAKNDFKYGEGTSSSGGLPPQPPSKTDSNVGTTDFTHGNQLTGDSVFYIPFTQKLDFFEDEGWFSWTTEDWVKDTPDSAKELLKHRMVSKGIGNEFYVEELDKNAIKMTKIGRQTYYRYHVNWGVLIFSLLVTTVALAITVIKIGRSVFDLAFHQIFGMFIAVTDLTGGQRTKKILVEIMNTFAVIFLMVFLLKLFILYSSWANGLKENIGGFGVLLMLIAGAWALIDAPDIVQRMLGIDAGLRNGWQAAMGGYAAMKTMGAAGKGAGKLIGAAAGTAGGAMAFGKRAVEGMAAKTPGEIEREPVKEMPEDPPENKPFTYEDPPESKPFNDNPPDDGGPGSGGGGGAPEIPTGPTHDTPVNDNAGFSESGGEDPTTRQTIPERQQTQDGVPTFVKTPSGKQQGKQGEKPIGNNATKDGSINASPNIGNVGNVGNATISSSIAESGAKPMPQSSSSGGKQQEATTAIPSNPKRQGQETANQTTSSGGTGSTVKTDATTADSRVKPMPESNGGGMNQASVKNTQRTADASHASNEAPIPSSSNANVGTGSGQANVTTSVNSTAGDRMEQVTPVPSVSTSGSGQTASAPTPVPTTSNSGTAGQTAVVPTPVVPTVSSGSGQATTVVTPTVTPTTGGSPSVGSTTHSAGPVVPATSQGGTQTNTTTTTTTTTSGGGSPQAPPTPTVTQAPTNQNTGTYGHKEAQHKNTILGGNPKVQKLKEDITRGGNSGFTLGQNVRKVGLGASRLARNVQKKMKNDDE